MKLVRISHWQSRKLCANFSCWHHDWLYIGNVPKDSLVARVPVSVCSKKHPPVIIAVAPSGRMNSSRLITPLSFCFFFFFFFEELLSGTSSSTLASCVWRGRGVQWNKDCGINLIQVPMIILLYISDILTVIGSYLPYFVSKMLCSIWRISVLPKLRCNNSILAAL